MVTINLTIYKWIQPSSRGLRIEYHVANRDDPDSMVLLIHPSPPQSVRPPIFTSAGQAKDYGPPNPGSSFLDILVTSGITKSTIYREFNEIQQSDDHHIPDPYTK